MQRSLIQDEIMPLLVLADVVLFPKCKHQIGMALDNNEYLFVNKIQKKAKVFIVSNETCKDDGRSLESIGVVAVIEDLELVSGNNNEDIVSLSVMPICRATAELVNSSHSKNNMVRVSEAVEEPDSECDYISLRYCERIINEILPSLNSIEGRNNFDIIKIKSNVKRKARVSLGCVIDYLAEMYPFPLKTKQDMLDCLSYSKRMELLYSAFRMELEFVELDDQIENKVMEKIDDSQREYYLREKLSVINSELGDSDNEIEEFRKKIDAIDASENVRKNLHKECRKLAKLPFGSPEGAVIRGYLDTCLSIPWGAVTEDKIDINAVQKKLDHDHYGMKKVKERILELISVRALVPDIKGQIICLAGPPGVGKTSIARSIAEALGRKYMRISLGGVSDEAEIRGHRKTYLGSMPGRIIDTLVKSEVMNPLILLDEIDKISSSHKGDPTSALLEVLDPEQNKSFVDHFVELPVDLSGVLFIATANDTSAIPAALYDRMEIIELPSYTSEEKAAIAKKYLVPKQMKNCGLTSSRLKISDTAIARLIEEYTREAGVRSLEREIGSLCRRCAKKLVTGESDKISVTARNLESFMDKPKFKREELPEALDAGMANGLAWTSVGGEMLEIEVAVMDGSGKLELTGQLGEVMQESAKAAMSCVRQRAAQLGIEASYYKDKDIHMHFPEGAVPKDGPSAGITIATALVSALTGVPVRGDVAMTGEVTIGGRVLAIGGLREKSMAALRHGIKTVIIPAANEPDISELSDAVKQGINFIPVKKIEEVFDVAFLSQFNAEKKEA